MFGVMDLNKGYCWNAEDLTMHEITNGYNPRPITMEDFIHKRPWTSWVIVPKEYINIWRSSHNCEHEGCFKDGTVECHVPEDPMELPAKDLENKFEYLCPDHAYESGYCSLCGSFWGGIETFDFNNPSHLCEHCQEQIHDEDFEENEGHEDQDDYIG